MRHGALDEGAAWHTIAGDFASTAGAFGKAMHILGRSSHLVWASIVMLAAISGCDRAAHPAAARGAPHVGGPALSKGSDGTAFDLADMVSAVSAGKGPTDIDLKFTLRDRPVVGEPVDIDVAVIPAHELDQIYATFSSADGLEITKGGRMPQIQRPEPGAPVSHTITIVPRRDGIFSVSATVLADSPTESTTHNFSIPIIAGTGITAPVAKPADVTQSTAQTHVRSQ
jgi:hypothetical protein